jgi:uncharacterized protein (DUF58 family)
VLLSDLLVPDGEAEALDLLPPGGAVLHVTDAAVGDPLGAAAAGGLALPPTVALRDSETGEVVIVTATAELRRRYARASAARAAALAARCAAAGLRYIPADTAAPVADLIFGQAELPMHVRS